MGIVGFGYAVSVWLPLLDAVNFSVFADNVDWVDTVAALSEQVVQFLLGITSQG